jgi:hypothetical protein
MKNFLGICLCAGIATATVTSVFAAELKEHTLRGFPKDLSMGKTYDDNTLTPPQIKSCLQTSRKLDLLSNILNSQSSGFNTAVAELNTLAEQVEASQAYLDSNPTKTVNDDAAIAERNDRVRAHNELVDLYNAKTDAYEKETKSYTENNDRYTEMRTAFTDDCARKNFYREDMDAVLLEN